MTPDSDPGLPRPPQDEENLRRLREEARQRLLQEENLHAEMEKMRTLSAPVYGGTPPERPFAATVYGGPPTGPVSRRWTLRGILLLILGILGGILAAIFGFRRWAAPVYGGPPAPVYGGPVPQPFPVDPNQPKIQPQPKPKHPPRKSDKPAVRDPSSSPAPVYGGPPPRPKPEPPPPPPQP